MLGFLKLGEKLGFSYIKTYNAYKYAEKIKKMKRKKQEEEQRKLLSSETRSKKDSFIRNRIYWSI